jgi:hypothetical protein
MHYLGKYGTAESRELYREHLRRWGYDPDEIPPADDPEDDERINELIQKFIGDLRELSSFAYFARIGKELHDLLHHADSLIAYRYSDEDEPTFSVTTAAASNTTKTHHAEDLLDALIAVREGSGRVKRCNRCRALKTLNQFSQLRKNSDGRNETCKRCEVARVQRWKKNKAAEQTKQDDPKPCQG